MSNDPDSKSKHNPLLAIYVAVGGCVATVSFLSNFLFYFMGPGAIWNKGFLETSVGLILGVFFSLLRVVTWPYGAYVLFNNPDGFLPWLLFPWYN
jgi:hypothetical protein